MKKIHIIINKLDRLWIGCVRGGLFFSNNLKMFLETKGYVMNICKFNLKIIEY